MCKHSCLPGGCATARTALLPGRGWALTTGSAGSVLYRACSAASARSATWRSRRSRRGGRGGEQERVGASAGPQLAAAPGICDADADAACHASIDTTTPALPRRTRVLPQPRGPTTSRLLLCPSSTVLVRLSSSASQASCVHDAWVAMQRQRCVLKDGEGLSQAEHGRAALTSSQALPSPALGASHVAALHAPARGGAAACCPPPCSAGA